nr:uncharacterized protein LOC105328237 isoform X2 [Crassostrea gigas]
MKAKRMLYVSLSSLDQNINDPDRKISILVECKEKSFNGVAVNFFAANPRQTNENRDILFHFNPRPRNTLVLNTFLQNGWQEEVFLRDDEFSTKLFENPFKLTIKVTDAEDTPKQMTAFGVFVNDAFLTTYLCPADITMASFIGFSPNLRISANIEDF